MNAPSSTPRPTRFRGVVILGVLVLAGLAAGGWWLYRVQTRAAALNLANKGQFTAAAPLLRAELERAPNDLELIHALTRGYIADDDRRAALPLLNHWCALVPSDPQPFALRMALHRQEQRYDLALADGLTLLRLDPHNEKYPLDVAGLYISTADYYQAEKTARAILARQPRQRVARLRLADALRNTERYQEAATLLDALLAEESNDTGVLLSRGALYVQMGEAPRGIPLLEAVIQLDPRRQRTGRHQLALAYQEAGREADARRVERELRAINEIEQTADAADSQRKNPDVKVRYGQAALAGGKEAQGLDILGEVLEAHPDHAGAHAALADYFERIGRPERAADHRRRAAGPR